MTFPKFIAYVFFFLLIGIGVSTYQHYGVSYDEFSGHTLGTLNYNYITQNDPAIFRYHDRDYAPAFETFLVIVEKILGISEGPTDQMFYLRHYLIFLTFCLGVVFFFLLCRASFNNSWLALLGCLMLVICPRIYGHAFFNSKDIPFMTFIIISVYSLMEFLRNPTLVRALVHAYFCALATDTRIGGVLIPGITLVMYALRTIELPQMRSWKSLSTILCYFLFFLLLTILMWPMLWHKPFANFIQFFQSASHFRYPYHVFYMGQWLRPIDHELPGHYLPIWIMSTIPISVLALFLLGTSSFLVSFKRGLRVLLEKPMIVISLLWIFIPVIITIVTKPTIYDGWRHFYFIYPAMIILAIQGLIYLSKYKTVFVFVLILLIFDLTLTVNRMIRIHPYEHAYFNQLVGYDLKNDLRNFDLNLWGVEYRKPIEYILNNDPSHDISVYSPNVFAPMNLLLMPLEKKEGFHFVGDPQLAKYWILDRDAMRHYRKDLKESNKLFMLTIEGVDVISVYQANVSKS